MFKNYVSIGNSITAGYQSGGLNDSVQQASYARLVRDPGRDALRVSVVRQVVQRHDQTGRPS